MVPFRSWLPIMKKHKRVAIRFLPLKQYEAAAPLVVKPKPGCISRIFMLFQGIRDDQTEEWKDIKISNSDVGYWQGVTGVFGHANQGWLSFRLMECGAMEVF